MNIPSSEQVGYKLALLDAIWRSLASEGYANTLLPNTNIIWWYNCLKCNPFKFPNSLELLHIAILHGWQNERLV